MNRLFEIGFAPVGCWRLRDGSLHFELADGGSEINRTDGSAITSLWRSTHAQSLRELVQVERRGPVFKNRIHRA